MMNVWGMTDIGLVRSENQDAYAVRRNEETGHLVCVVCDGMGGISGGRVASGLAVEIFMSSCLSNLQKGMEAQDVRRVAEFAILSANSTIYQRSCEQSDLRGMGTTLVSAIVWNDTALLSNVGDSRAYLIRPTGEGTRAVRLTKDHSLVERMIDLGNITEEEARSHPDRNLITRALGPDPDTHSDSYLEVLESGDWLLLCTDGLSATVTDQEMADAVLENRDGNGSLKRLLDIARSRGAPDNVTAVLLYRH